MKPIVPTIHAVGEIPVDTNGKPKAGQAAAPPALPRNHDITGWCRLCEQSAREAQQAAIEEDPEMDNNEMVEIIAGAYLCTMPLITDRESAQCFIACVARALALNLISTDRAGKLVYVAQTALSAHRRI